MNTCPHCNALLREPIERYCRECGGTLPADAGGSATVEGPAIEGPEADARPVDPGESGESGESGDTRTMPPPPPAPEVRAELTVCQSCGHVVPADSEGTCPRCGNEIVRPVSLAPPLGVGLLVNRVARTFLVSGAAAVVFTVIMNVLLRGLVTQGAWLHAVLFPAGAMATVPWLILLLLFWGDFWLGLRVWLGRREREMLDGELTESILRMIGSAQDRSIRAALQTLHGLPGDQLGVFLERAKIALEEWDRGRDLTQVRQSVLDQGAIDGDTLEGSLNIVRVFIWATPIIGFIGTVLGISLSVGEFSAMIGGSGGTMQMDQIQQGLMTVTGGLAYAFNTTLVGLVAALLLMVPTTYVQRYEDELLGDVHKRIADLVLPALSRQEQAVDLPGPDIDGMKQIAAAISEAVQVLRAVEESLRAHSATLTEQVQALGTIDESLTALEGARAASAAQHEETLSALGAIAEKLGGFEEDREDSATRHEATLSALGAISDRLGTLCMTIGEWPSLFGETPEARQIAAATREQQESMLRALLEIRASMQRSVEGLAAIERLAGSFGGPFEIRLASGAAPSTSGE